MWGIRSLLQAVLVSAAVMLGGCSPSILCTIETEILPDYTCLRVARMEAFPSPRFPNQQPKLGEYYQFPPAELYDNYAVQQDKALFAGSFESFDKIPSDLVRATPGAVGLAGNLLSFRVMDMVLFVLADFDETITDIVQSQEDGEAAMTELIRLVVPELMAVLNAKYGQRYDLSRLESYLNNDLPAKLRRIYAGAWAIHAAKRSGVTSPGEDFEFYMFLRAEAYKEGLELAEPNHPDLQQENIRRLKDYGVRLAQHLCPPRAGQAAPNQELLAGVAIDELLASLQQAITVRHGSINSYIGKIAALVPRAFGAYLTSSMMPIYMLPETTYRYRMRIPGMVIQTNGVRELNGDLVWNFTDRDLAFTGQSLWARSIFVREPALYGLGLRGFPASLGDVDKVFGFCLGEDGTPREALLRALREAVTARSQGPLDALAGSASADAGAARGLLALFEQHRQAVPQSRREENTRPARQERQPAAPASQAGGVTASAVPAPQAPIEAPPLP